MVPARDREEAAENGWQRTFGEETARSWGLDEAPADLKRTIAVLLDDILQRLGRLENKIDYLVVNGSSSNSTNSTTGNPVPLSTSKRNPASGKR